MKWAVIVLIYLIGGFSTFLYNMYLVREAFFVSPNIMVRNAIFWPVMLPMLIMSSKNAKKED